MSGRRGKKQLQFHLLISTEMKLRELDPKQVLILTQKKIIAICSIKFSALTRQYSCQVCV